MSGYVPVFFVFIGLALYFLAGRGRGNVAASDVGAKLQTVGLWMFATSFLVVMFMFAEKTFGFFKG